MLKYYFKSILVSFILLLFTNNIAATINKEYKYFFCQLTKTESKGNFNKALEQVIDFYNKHFSLLNYRQKKLLSNIILNNSLRVGNIKLFRENVSLNSKKYHLYKQLPDNINTVTKHSLSKTNLSNNQIVCNVQHDPLNLNISSNIDDYITLSTNSLNNLKSIDIIGSYWELNTKTNLYVHYTIGIIKRLVIENCEIKNVFVKISPHYSDAIGFGLLKSFNVNIDYTNNELTLDNKTDLQLKHKFKFENGLPHIPSEIFNLGIKTSFNINLSNQNNILTFDTFKDKYIKEYFFQKQHFFYTDNIVSKLITASYYNDFDFKLGDAKFYNTSFLIINKSNQEKIKISNQLYQTTLMHCSLTFDFTNMLYSIVNNEEKNDYLENLVSQNELSEVLRLTTRNIKNKKDIRTALLRFYALFRMENYKECETILDDIVDVYQTNKYDVDDFLYMTMYLYVILTEQSPTPNNIKKSINYITNYSKINNTLEAKIIKYIDAHNLKYNDTVGYSGLVQYKTKYDKIIPKVKINNKKVENFIFDTGSPLNIVTRYTANKLHIITIAKNIIPITSSFRDSSTRFLDLGFIDKLQLGGVELHNIYCAISPCGFLANVKGIIGGGISEKLNYIINDKNHTLYFSKRKKDIKSLTQPANKNLYIINDTPFIKINLFDLQTNTIQNQKEFAILFDTGNDFSFGTYQLLFENKIDLSSKKTKHLLSLDVSGIDLYPVVYKPYGIRLFNRYNKSYSNIKIKYFFFRPGFPFYFPDPIKNYGNLGYNFIKNHILYLNFDKNQSFIIKGHF